MPRHIISTAETQTITGDLSVTGDFSVTNGFTCSFSQTGDATIVFNATSYTFGTGAAVAMKTALGIGDDDQNILAVSIFA